MQYDSYMKDYANLAAVTKKLIEQKQNLETQCEHCQGSQDQVIGTYKGQEYQHIQHNEGCKCIHQALKNQIVSQSKIIIPRGIIHFKKGHSVSIERNGGNYGMYNENLNQPKIIFNNDLEEQDPYKLGQSRQNSQARKDYKTVQSPDTLSDNPSDQRTFALEPRDESLMRKKKVIEILKTFQDQDQEPQSKQQNLGE